MFMSANLYLKINSLKYLYQMFLFQGHFTLFEKKSSQLQIRLMKEHKRSRLYPTVDYRKKLHCFLRVNDSVPHIRKYTCQSKNWLASF